MVKIDKQYAPTAIPISLRVPVPENFDGGIINAEAIRTHERRGELVAARRYLGDDKYDRHYKQTDVKEALKALYRHKCAYCEEQLEQGHIDHYRPKASYYWLAFSWDNLLWTCPTCNQNKHAKFNIGGEQIEIAFEQHDINRQSYLHDAIELPLLVNPEVTDPEGQLVFEKDGSISSSDHRFDYTIKTCRLNRKYLNDARLKILNDFQERVNTEFLLAGSNREGLNIRLGVLIRNFKSDAAKADNEYLAFRRYIMEHWLREILIAGI